MIEQFDFPIDGFEEQNNNRAVADFPSDDLDKDLENIHSVEQILPSPAHDCSTYAWIAGRYLRLDGEYFHVLTEDEIGIYLASLTDEQRHEVTLNTIRFISLFR